MAKRSRTTKSADSVILDVLAYEDSLEEQDESHRKIRRRLRYYGVGTYQQDRVDLLRRFKDEIKGEIKLGGRRGGRSAYYIGNHSGYSEMDDFDRERLALDMGEAYPDIPQGEIHALIAFAIYLYYMR